MRPPVRGGSPAWIRRVAGKEQFNYIVCDIIYEDMIRVFCATT
jgi:hypothetical protein